MKPNDVYEAKELLKEKTTLQEINKQTDEGAELCITAQSGKRHKDDFSRKGYQFVFKAKKEFCDAFQAMNNVRIAQVDARLKELGVEV